MIPAIMDIEASGFGKGSYPIEIAVATSEKDIVTFLIKPEPEWVHWDESAQEIHGISRTMIEQNGTSIVDVAETLNQLFEGQTLYSDGWGFDSSWLSLLFYHAKRRQAFKLDALTRILTQSQLETWDDTRAKIMDASDEQRHRANTDAKVIQQTFVETAKL